MTYETFTTEDRRQLMALRRKGYTFSEIESEIGHSRYTCRDYFNRLPTDIKSEIREQFNEIQYRRISERNRKSARKGRLQRALKENAEGTFDDWGRCFIARMMDKDDAADLIDEVFTEVHGDETFEEMRLK